MGTLKLEEPKRSATVGEISLLLLSQCLEDSLNSTFNLKGLSRSIGLAEI